jgi:hypothetical protein
MTSPRYRIAIRSDDPPDDEALDWLRAIIAIEIDRLRRLAVDETLSPSTMARFARIRASLEPTEAAASARWEWVKD